MLTDDNRPALQPTNWGNHAILILRGNAKKTKPTGTGRFSVSNDPNLAIAYRADGLHFSRNTLSAMGKINIRLLKQRFYLSAAAHDIKALYRIRKYQINAALVSPVFKTVSHPDKSGIGALRFRMMVRNAGKTDIYPMGGIDFITIKMLQKQWISGIAGASFVAQLPQMSSCSGGRP